MTYIFLECIIRRNIVAALWAWAALALLRHKINIYGLGKRPLSGWSSLQQVVPFICQCHL